MCLQTKSYHLSKELDCTTLCNLFIVMLNIYICVILIGLLLYTGKFLCLCTGININLIHFFVCMDECVCVFVSVLCFVLNSNLLKK